MSIFFLCAILFRWMYVCVCVRARRMILCGFPVASFSKWKYFVFFSLSFRHFTSLHRINVRCRKIIQFLLTRINRTQTRCKLKCILHTHATCNPIKHIVLTRYVTQAETKITNGWKNFCISTIKRITDEDLFNWFLYVRGFFCYCCCIFSQFFIFRLLFYAFLYVE